MSYNFTNGSARCFSVARLCEHRILDRHAVVQRVAPRRNRPTTCVLSVGLLTFRMTGPRVQVVYALLVRFGAAWFGGQLDEVAVGVG